MSSMSLVFTPGASPSVSSNGWTSDTNTWTYVSATSFKVSGSDVTAIFSKGTRLRLKQGGSYLYFVVTASSFSTDTTVTITGGSDYTLANASITNNDYSYQENPQGYPGWFNYDCAPTGFSGTPTQRTSRFAVAGKVCTLYIDVTGTSNATTFTCSLPISAQRSFQAFAAQGADAGSSPTSPFLATIGSAPTTTLTFFKDWNALGFTNTGSKEGQVSLFYEI